MLFVSFLWAVLDDANFFATPHPPPLFFFPSFFSFFSLSSFNTPWVATYTVNKWIFLGRVFNKEFRCIYHYHNNEHSFFFTSPLDDLISPAVELASLGGCQ